MSSEGKHSHHEHGVRDGEQLPHDPGPYWRRAHRDWRLWAALLFCLAAIAMYVMSDNLSLHFGH